MQNWRVFLFVEIKYFLKIPQQSCRAEEHLIRWEKKAFWKLRLLSRCSSAGKTLKGNIQSNISKYLPINCRKFMSFYRLDRDVLLWFIDDKNLVCNNHTTSITSYYTYFKFYEVHFSLLSLTEDSFSQSGVPS